NELLRVITIGVFGNMVYQLFFIVGLDHTAPGNASMLLAGTPIITALLSTLLGHERPRWSIWFGVFCTFVGIALIVFSSATMSTSRGSLLGDVLMFGASILWAFYTVGSRNLVDLHGPILVTAWTLWVGTIGLFLVGIPDLLKTNWSAVSGGSWLAVLYAGILSIGVAYVIWYYGVDRLGNTRTSIYSNITPVIAVLSAWFFLGEVPRTLQLVGAAVIIAGVTVAQLARGEPAG
ncbi:MAG TPA: EamA family transporter, partial [Longimicrobiales bacterium]|nr:EamA family transporter [Longimicrobiales bacterium]